jgi:hypothetical protein
VHGPAVCARRDHAGARVRDEREALDVQEVRAAQVLVPHRDGGVDRGGLDLGRHPGPLDVRGDVDAAGELPEPPVDARQAQVPDGDHDGRVRRVDGPRSGQGQVGSVLAGQHDGAELGGARRPDLGGGGRRGVADGRDDRRVAPGRQRPGAHDTVVVRLGSRDLLSRHVGDRDDRVG